MQSSLRKKAWLKRRRIEHALLAILILGLLVILVIRSCSVPGATEDMETAEQMKSEVEEPVYGGNLRVGIGDDLNSLDPHQATTPQERMVARAVTDSLFTFDPSGGVEPNLVEDWQVNDDGVKYEFELRSGITFSDGTKLDAEAVEFNIERMREVGPPIVPGAWLSSIREIEVTDELSFTIDLWHPDPNLLFNLSRAEMGLVSPQAVEEREEDFAFEPVGLGPFIAANSSNELEYSSEKLPEGEVPSVDEAPEALSEITVRVFADYWRGRPRLDCITFTSVDSDVEPADLIDANFDVITDVPQGYEIPEEQGDHYLMPNLDHHMLALNVADEKLSDNRLRKALHNIIDRDTIIERAFSGDAEPLYIGGYPGNVDGHMQEEPDRERARELLTESDYSDGISLSMLSSDEDQHITISRLIASQLEEFDIEVQIDTVSAEDYYEKMRAGDYQISYWSLQPRLPGPFGYTANLRSDSHWNVSQIWRSEDADDITSEVDELLIKAASSSKEAEANDCFRDFFDLVARENIYISLWFTQTRIIHSDEVRDLHSPYSHSFDFWQTWLSEEPPEDAIDE